MKFSEILTAAKAWLQREGRLTYRSLKLEFDLDEETLDALKEELLFSSSGISEINGRGLIWNGDGASAVTFPRAPAPSQSPASYTPQHLAERILAEQAAMESRGSANGERKTITALFADLKGSTALIEGLDPEDARAIIDPALQLMMDAVHRYDGYVAQALGDGIFALFGAPIAHEDHPQRALYAALRMQAEMRQQSDRSRLKGGIPLQLRVGINTGEVVVRSIRKDDLHTDYVPVGHSTNLAARMEQMATPGSIVISEYTRKLTEGYFELKALGAADIKGVEEPLNVYEVLSAGPLRTRLQVSARRGLTRFVGRQSELDQMRQALEQAKAGHGQIVGVMGGPGLGKSRLFYEFKLTSQSGYLVLEAFSASYGKASPYLPIIELLKTYFQIEPTDEERSRREHVIGKVLGLDRSLEDTLPYLFSLLGIEDGQSSLHQMDAQIRRRRTFEALKKLFLRESLNQPLILICEDLHWIDSETQGFLETLSESVASAQVLLLVNYRPEYRPEWGHKTYYTQLRLAPLGKVEAEELLTFLLGIDASLTQLKSLILDRTEGTPFFMEEVVQTLAEEEALSGERGNYCLKTTPTEFHISPTVQGVLAARIDRLTIEEKSLLQQLAVIGRQFPASLIKHIVTQPEAELYRVLSSLQAKEFLYEQPAFPESEYIFKHALTQDVAYGTVLQERRKALHERTAQTIEELYKENLDDHYGALAHHYSHSDNTEKAVEYLSLAGQQALARSANEESIRYLQAALERLAILPRTPERSQQELALRTALGPSLLATHGWAAPEVKRVYTRALEISQQQGNTQQLPEVLFGIWTYCLNGGEIQKGRAVAEQLHQLALRGEDAELYVASSMAVGFNAHVQGEFLVAREHLQESYASYDPAQHRSYVHRYGYDVGVNAEAILAHVLWHLGYPTLAQQTIRECLTHARELRHPLSLMVVLAWAGTIGVDLSEWHRAKRAAAEAIALGTEHEFSDWLAWGYLMKGVAAAELGQWKEGIAEIRDASAKMQASGASSYRTQIQAHLTRCSLRGGQIEDGFREVAEAFPIVEQTGERYHEAELHRLNGELFRQRSPIYHAEAEVCFQRALEVARQQHAKSWELRAATSLARLWQSQGKVAAARDLLAPVYDWFTEGFDTADLQDAKTLLVKLETSSKEEPRG